MTGNENLTNTDWIKFIKLSDMLNINNMKEDLKTSLIDKLNTSNACFYYGVLKNNKHKVIEDFVLSHIERWFCLISQNNKHLDLSFDKIKNICLSCSLKITSEIEVIKFADSWIKHDEFERRQYAINLIKTIRLPLLSNAALLSLLQNKNSFSNCKISSKYIKNSISNRNSDSFDTDSVDYQNRYFSQNRFHMLVPCNTNAQLNKYIYQLYEFDRTNLSQTADLIKTEEKIEEALYNNGIIYLLSSKVYRRKYRFSTGLRTVAERVKTLTSYLVSTKKLSELYEFSDNYLSCTCCMFMGKIYIITPNVDQCFAIDPKSKKQLKIANRIQFRLESSSAVYGGRIVVSGGTNKNNSDEKSVEVYDQSANDWSLMPSMIEGRHGHASVSIRNKLYMIGGNVRQYEPTCEVFDSFSRVFVNIEPSPKSLWRNQWLTTPYVTLGKKIVFLYKPFLEPYYFFYLFDIEKEEWTEDLSWNFVEGNFNVILPKY